MLTQVNVTIWNCAGAEVAFSGNYISAVESKRYIERDAHQVDRVVTGGGLERFGDATGTSRWRVAG
jgi:hypothetical protein